jgi:hypothetical protein
VQGLPFSVQAPVQAQPEGVVQQPVGFHSNEGAIRGGPAGHVEQLLLAQLQGLMRRRVQLPGGEGGQKAAQQQQNLQQPQ